MKKLHLISNDKIWVSEKKYTSNNDLNNILSCLSSEYEVDLISRQSLEKFDYLIKEKFNFSEIKNIDKKYLNILMISITPFNFFSFIKLILLKKKIKGFVLLRSDGFLEYRIRYGFIGYFLYFIMFYLIKKKLKIIAVSNTFSHVNVQNILHPSELTDDWFVRAKNNEKIETDFLYVGRFKKEKGVYYLIKIFKEHFGQYQLTIAGTEKKLIDPKYFNKNINYIGPLIRPQDLINLYDSSRIFILPSYTEGFPKVISEALARLKPIIIFEEIKHVVDDREGIFVCKRNEKNIRETINYILKNYKKIQKKIIENKFYTKNDFKTELLNTIKDEFTN